MRVIGIGLLGLGNVGSGLVKLLDDNADSIAARIGARLEVRRVAVRAVEKRRVVDVDRRKLTTDVSSILDDPEIQIVVELIGGESPAREYILGALQRGKHVVTANKALLATHGGELFDAAEQRGLDLFYEASVCGGVPIIRALRDGLASDRIDSLTGIVNGTSNYILTRMADEGRPFDEVLGEAQAQGYAEADPSLDVDGWDAAHKLCVLASLCFGVRVPLEGVLVDGLRGLTPLDFGFAKRFGYVVKPLVVAVDHGSAIEARVHPAMIPARWMLASVSGVFNAVYVSSQALGQSMYYGRGAGMMPTAVAVVSDVIEVARDILGSATSGQPLRLRARDRRERPMRDPADLWTRYYLRFTVADRPGVLAELAGILAAEGVSIREVVQEAQAGSAGAATVVITTHAAREGNMQRALAGFAALGSMTARPQLLRIVE